MTGPADAAAGSAGAEDADAAGTGLMPGDGARRRSSSTSSESRPFERASPVRTVMSESPVAESFVPSKTPTKRSPAPRFTLGSLEGSPESPPRLAKAMARSETQSSSNTVTQATAGAGSPRGDRVERAPSGNLAAKPPAVDATPVGLRKVEVVEISPIAASPDDMDEDEIEAAEGEVGQRLREDEDDTDDEDEDITDDDEPDRDTPDGSDEDDVGDTIGDEDDPDSDDSGERERPRTFRAKPFRKPIPPTAAAPKAEEKVATSVSSNSSILSTKSSAAGDAKDGKASDALKRETSSGKVSFKEPPPHLRRASSVAASASADALPPAVGVKTAPGAPVGLQEVPLQPARATPSSLSSSFKRTEGFSIDPRKREEKAEKVVRVSSLGDKMNLPIVASGSPSAGGLAMRLKQKPLEGGSLTTVSRVPSADAAVPTPASVLVNANKPSPVPRTPEPILASPKRSQSPGVKVAQTSPVRPRSPAKPAADAGNTPERTLPNVAQGQTSSPSRPTDAPKSVLAGARSAVNAANPNAPLGKPSRSTTPELPRPTSSAKVDDRPLAGTPFQPTFSPKVPAALGAGAYRLSPAPGPEAGSIVRTVSPALSGSGGSYQDPSQLSSSAVSQTVVSSSPTTAMSRTQKKLMLQRQSVMASEPPQVTQRAPSRLARESERASKEYWNSTRRWADPMQESLDRVMAAIREERVKAGLPVEPEVEADDRTAASTTAVTSQASSTTSSTPQPPSPIARPSNQLQPSESTVNLQNRRLQSARDGMRRIQSAPGMAAAAGRTRSSGLWNMLFGN